jgi:hypothetical protein
LRRPDLFNAGGRYGKESRLLLVAFPSASPIGGERSVVSTLYSYVV